MNRRDFLKLSGAGISALGLSRFMGVITMPYKTNAIAPIWTKIGNKAGFIPLGTVVEVGGSRTIKGRLVAEITSPNYSGKFVEPHYLGEYNVSPPPVPPPQLDNGLVIDNAQDLKNVLAMPSPPRTQIYIRGGTYELAEQLHCVWKEPATISGFRNETVIIKPVAPAYFALLIEGSGTTWKNIVVDGTNVQNATVKITMASNIVFRDIEVVHGGGVLVTHCKNIAIQNCHIHDNGTNKYVHGVYLSDDNDVTVAGCDIHHNSGHGVHTFVGANDQRYTIERNYIHDHGDRGIGVYYGVATVRNNILRRCGTGIAIAYDIVTAYIHNNTVTGSQNWGGGIAYFTLNAPAKPVSVDVSNNILDTCSSGFNAINTKAYPNTVILSNNLFSKCSVPIIKLDAPENITQANNITADAMVNDDGVEKFIPMPNSPARKAGLPLTDVYDDYIGHLRIAPPTIGAWE
jgi:hypothetical protein